MTLQSVLLVDEEPDIRRIGELLTVWSAAGAEDAIALAKLHEPDLILLDVMTRGGDGPTAFARPRGAAETAAIPVLSRTAKATPAHIAADVSLGTLGVVRKPFDPMTLPAIVQALVERGS